MTTLYIHAPAAAHNWPDHPENANRGEAVWQLLQKSGTLASLLTLEPSEAGDQPILAVHSPYMLDRIEEICLRGGGYIDQDTYATPQSYQLAKLAVGGVCLALDKIVGGQARNGYVFARPPGHHAERRQPGGFCLLNNIAIGARHLQTKHQLQKICILDFDVHHGNGTQEIFYQDETVFFISIHQHSPFFYPGTGSLREVGDERGRGHTLNVGLFEGVGDHGYRRIFEEIIRPAVRRFRPDFILISAGYDAHWVDPLAAMNLTLRGYAHLSQIMVELAEELCQGRILFVQEGGYVLQALSHGVLNSLFALQGRDEVRDPIGRPDNNEPDVTKLLSIVQELHLIK